MRLVVPAAIVTALSGISTSSAPGGLITYSDRADWEAQLSSIQTEEFSMSDTGTLAPVAVHQLGLLQFTYTGAPDQSRPRVIGNLFEGNPFRVTAGGGTINPGPHQFFLPFQVIAIGADFVSAERLTLSAGGVTVALPVNSGSQFFGVISDTPFTSFAVNHSQTGSVINDLYSMDNVSFGTPEPSSLALLGMGSLTLFSCGWRRRRSTQLAA